MVDAANAYYNTTHHFVIAQRRATKKIEPHIVHG